jgi:hypothetical protein
LTPGLTLGLWLTCWAAVSRGATPDLAEVKAKLKERRDKIQSIWVEYRVNTQAFVDPKLLIRWDLLHIHPYKVEQHVAYKEKMRYDHRIVADSLPFILPPEEVEPDPAAPAFVRQIMEGRKRDGARMKAARGEAPRFGPEDHTWLFDGSRSVLVDNTTGRGFVHGSDGRVNFPRMYLAAVGLHPPDPLVAEKMAREREVVAWLPDALDTFAACRVLDRRESIDGAECTIVEAEQTTQGFDRKFREVQRFWLDPARGMALIKRETWYDDLLGDRWTNSAFKEVAPGIWMPMRSEWQRGTPYWVDASNRGKAGYAYQIRVTKIHVNDVADEVFRPDPAVKLLDSPALRREAQQKGLLPGGNP